MRLVHNKLGYELVPGSRVCIGGCNGTIHSLPDTEHGLIGVQLDNESVISHYTRQALNAHWEIGDRSIGAEELLPEGTPVRWENRRGVVVDAKLVPAHPRGQVALHTIRFDGGPVKEVGYAFIKVIST
jgi:hypothetical protein